ncbi:MAG: HD domain-containing protein [Methylococcaceae bacterium]|nr:HD domain-containing protein [Methylococcaceae bacterium]
MSAKKRSSYSLHFTISTLFISFTLIFGAALSWQHYSKTSEILIAGGDLVFNQINRELSLNFGGLLKSAKQSISLLALSPVTQAHSLDERLKSLSRFSTALHNEEKLSAIQIAYPNGDYFIMRPINSELLRLTFNTPPNAAFVVDNISTDAQGQRNLMRIFYTEQLLELSRDPVIKTNYDPRIRPWYTQALKQYEVSSTSPYLFYFIRQVGTTLALQTPTKGVVIAADVTLDQLSNTLTQNTITPNTKIVVFDKNGNALVYGNINRLIIETTDGTFKIAKLEELGSDVLAFLSKDLQIVSQPLDFIFNRQKWLGAIREMHIPGGKSFFVLMVSPENELLSTAIKIRDQSVLLAAIIILIAIPIIWLFARQISKPIRHLAGEAGLISRFDFSSPITTRSAITEVEELAIAMKMMKSTISQFLSLIHSLAGEQNLDDLLQSTTQQTTQISQADAALTYLYDEQRNCLKPSFMHMGKRDFKHLTDLPEIPVNDDNELAQALKKKTSSQIELAVDKPNPLNPLLDKLETHAVKIIALPLRNRDKETIGLLCLLYKKQGNNQNNEEHLAFVQQLSDFAAVSLESRQLLMMQKALFASFIKLIADAIDSKSAYTGGHCARVPEIAKLIAQAACNSTSGSFKDFQLNEDQWESLHIASWLHDCGKVTTPEYVVDKSTKLETIYDRIHEIRMRVEVLKRDAEIDYWQQIAKGLESESLGQKLEAKLQQLDQDFAFIAECNEGGEFMSQEKIQRLAEIAEYTWERTLDDRLGVSWEERQRQQKTAAKALPVREKLLADKAEHIIEREAGDKIPQDNPWGFKLDVPEYKYNRGELYNLSIEKGTLTEEERFKINDHIVQTIIMLQNLPYPKYLADVPLVAGSHHEKMDGTGYPKRLMGADMPLTARIMAIADIFEALTASDRPYKKAKPLSVAIRIMSDMAKNQHIDPELFSLFLSSGCYLEYAYKFLDSEQIDDVDISKE